MVLSSILEDLLHGTGTAWSIDDTSLGDGNDTILTHAVVEVLGNVSGKRCGRFMAIVPRRDGKAAELGLHRESLHHLEGTAQPTFIPKGRRRYQHLQGLFHLLVSSTCHISP